MDRKLRIAASVFFGLLTLALCALAAPRVRDNSFGQFVMMSVYATMPLPLSLMVARAVYRCGDRIRFSLRTLLIATTLMAVMLGLGVWLAR